MDLVIYRYKVINIFIIRYVLTKSFIDNLTF